MISVSIRAYELEVEIQSSESYPDHLNDLCNRAIQSFQNALGAMLAAGIAIADEEIEQSE